MKNQKLNLTEDPVPQLIIKMAVPVSIGFFFHTMFNVVDTYFASQINSVVVAAITITFPIFFMIIAISSGTRQGATALIANAEGANDKALAKQYLVQTISFSIIAAIFIMIVGLVSAPYLFLHHHRFNAQTNPRHRPERSETHPRRDGKNQNAIRLQRQPRGVFQVPAHGRAVLL